MRVNNSEVMVALDASIDEESAAINAQFVWDCSVMAVSTGAATGTLKIQVSNDPIGPGAPSNWVDLSGATVNVTAASKVIIPRTELSYNWIKLVYSKNNGSAGTISAYLHTKGF